MNNVSAPGKETFCSRARAAPAGGLPRAGAPDPAGWRTPVIWPEDGAEAGVRGRGRRSPPSGGWAGGRRGVSREPTGCERRRRVRARARAGGRGWGVSRPGTRLRGFAPRLGGGGALSARAPLGEPRRGQRRSGAAGAAVFLKPRARLLTASL